MMAVRTVTVGERVVLDFRERDKRQRGWPCVNVPHYGTVEAFDEGGIHIRLDVPVNGLGTCYATYREVRHAGRRGGAA